MGILIPKVLEAYTNLQIPRHVESATAEIIAGLAAGDGSWDPSVCTACGECEAKCPNKIPISELMAGAAQIWPKWSD